MFPYWITPKQISVIREIPSTDWLHTWIYNMTMGRTFLDYSRLPNLNMHQNYSEGLLKCRLLSLTPRVLDSGVGLRLRFYPASRWRRAEDHPWRASAPGLCRVWEKWESLSVLGSSNGSLGEKHCSRRGVGKLRAADQIRPTTHVCERSWSGTRLHSFAYGLPVAAFMLHRWSLVRLRLWLVKPKMFTNRFLQPLLWTNEGQPLELKLGWPHPSAWGQHNWSTWNGWRENIRCPLESSSVKWVWSSLLERRFVILQISDRFTQVLAEADREVYLARRIWVWGLARVVWV